VVDPGRRDVHDHLPVVRRGLLEIVRARRRGMLAEYSRPHPGDASDS
jgi:hypothetical protein